MKNKSLIKKIKKDLFYCGIEKSEYEQVYNDIAAANHKALTYWSVLVSFFWIYCLIMSLFKDDYAVCRPAYAISLSCTVFSFICSRFIVTKFPSTLAFFKFFFRLSLLGGGIGIALCQSDVRSLTLFAVAIISPSIFIDSTISSLMVHICTLVIYISAGIYIIQPDIFYWGLANYMLFSVFGFLIGNAINKERSERYVYADYEKKLADMQTRYAYFDRMTGLRNRHAFEDKLLELEENKPAELCVVMADINGLKEMNDTIGHKAGDELIIGASECLSNAFDNIESIYRIGGDEFCIIMPGTIEKANECLSRLDEMLERWHGRYIHSISVSTGVASVKDYNSIDDLVTQADKNMYKCKRDYYRDHCADDRKH